MTTHHTGGKKPAKAGEDGGVARLQLAALNAGKQLVAQLFHCKDLFRGIGSTIPGIVLILAVQSAMASQNSLDSLAQKPTGLVDKQVGISESNVNGKVAVVLGLQKAGTHSVGYGVPLVAAGHPKIGAESSPEADKGAKKPNNQAVGVDPAKQRIRRHLFLVWLAFWAASFCAGWSAGQRSKQ